MEVVVQAFGGTLQVSIQIEPANAGRSLQRTMLGRLL